MTTSQVGECLLVVAIEVVYKETKSPHTCTTAKATTLLRCNPDPAQVHAEAAGIRNRARAGFQLFHVSRAALKAGAARCVGLQRKLRAQVHVRRWHCIPIAGDSGGPPLAWHVDPRFLWFEFQRGWLLRRTQVQLVCDLAAGAIRPPKGCWGREDGADAAHRVALQRTLDYVSRLGVKDGGSLKCPHCRTTVRDAAALKHHEEHAHGGAVVRQMLMGQGKTTCISPLLVMFLADQRSLVVQVLIAMAW